MVSAIFKTFLLSLCIVANTHLAYAQTASILPPAKTQFLDNSGKPLTSGKVFNYIPSTTTFKTTWQDAAETVANTNPVILDAGGRAKILGEGSYRQIVKDRLDNIIWDAVTSSTGSGGGGSSPSIGDGNLVGTIIPWSGFVAPVGYVFAYGQEISRTTYDQYFTAATLTQNVTCTSGSPIVTSVSDTSQLNVGAAVEASCLPVSTVIVSKTSNTVTLNNNAIVSTTASAVFFPYGNGNGITTLNVPDLRGYTLVGRCNMGGSTCTSIDTSSYGADPSGLNSTGGNKTKTLIQANLPAATLTTTVSITDPGHQHSYTKNTSILSTGTAGGIPNVNTGEGTGSTASNTTGITATGTTALGGSSTPISLIQPSKTTNYAVKISPNITLNTITGAGFTGTGYIVLQSDALINRPTITNSPSASFSGPVFMNAETVPANITVAQNDYNPSSAVCVSTSELQVSATSALDITGFGGGISGCLLKIINNGSFTITFKVEDAGSLAINRFAIGADVPLGSQQSTLFSYDGVNSRWRLIGGPPGGGGGGGTVTAVGTSGCTSGGAITTSGTVIVSTGCVMSIAGYTAGGTADDTVGVQSAFTACTAASGCTLTCGNGVVYTVDNITVGSNTRLTGGCTFQQRTSSNSILTATTKSKIIIDGVTFKATTPTVNTVPLISLISTTNDVKIVNSTFIGSATVDTGLATPTGGANAIQVESSAAGASKYCSIMPTILTS